MRIPEYKGDGLIRQVKCSSADDGNGLEQSEVLWITSVGCLIVLFIARLKTKHILLVNLLFWQPESGNLQIDNHSNQFSNSQNIGLIKLLRNIRK
jgi:hypothetical protein